MAAGFGISDKLSLHLNAEMTRHIQKNTDPEVTARESKKSKFSGATLASQYVFTDRMGWFHSGLSLYGKSSGEKNGKFSYVRDQNPVYGIILGQSFGDLTGSHVSLDIGAQFKNASTDEVLRETHRYHSSLTAYVGVFDSLSLFTGLSGQEINSKEPNKKIYSASYHYGLEWNYSGLEVSAYGSYGLKSASYGTGRQEGGLAISYTFGSVSNVSSESKTKAEAHTEKSKASKPAKKEQVEEEEQISIEKIVEQLPKSKNPEEMDEFELQELRQKEEQKKFGNGLTEWEKIEQELEQIKATEKLQKEADERRQKEQERVDRANRVKNTKEEERRLKVLQEEVADEVNSLEGVSDDELNWRGLD